MYVEYKHIAVDPFDGAQHPIVEQWDIIESGSPSHPYRAARRYGDKIIGDHNTWIQDRTEFERVRMDRLKMEGEQWIGFNAKARQYKELIKTFNTRVVPVLVKRGLLEDDEPFLYKVFREAIGSDREFLDRFLVFMDEPFKTAGTFRAAVRRMVTAGKELARAEHPQDYKEAGDKDDFYDENISLVADGFAGEI